MDRFVLRALILAAVTVFATIAQAQLTAYNWVTGLSAPVQMVQHPTDPTVKYVVQQTGRIRVIVNGVIQGFDFLDLSGLIYVPGPPPDALNERGLLGLEFAPDYATSGHCYVNYTDRTGVGNTQIARFTRSIVNPLTADFGSRHDIIYIPQPFQNHNGGTLRFGPDGFLYIGMGDGGNGNDPGNRAQDPNQLLGKMLRIDPTQDDFPADPNRNYRIPPDNPFLDGIPVPALGEIWAFGLRNPYRWSFDRASLGGTNALIIGDVGQNAWEEIDYEPAGAGGRNYGWRVREGAHNTGLTGGPYTTYWDPIHEYARGAGAAVVGGYVYRGTLLPGMQGRYFFADYIQRRVWSVMLTIGGGGEATASNLIEHTTELGGSSFLGNISCVDIDNKGELYLLSANGRIIRIIPAGPINVAPDAFTVAEGQYVSGGIPELANSDDQHLVARRWKTPAFGPHVQVVVEGTSARMTSTGITVTVEAHASHSGLIQSIEAFNFTSGTWTTLDTIAAPTSDAVRAPVITTNPSQYIQAGSGRVRVRIGYAEQTPNLPRWSGRIDQVRWTVNP